MTYRIFRGAADRLTLYHNLKVAFFWSGTGTKLSKSSNNVTWIDGNGNCRWSKRNLITTCEKSVRLKKLWK